MVSIITTWPILIILLLSGATTTQMMPLTNTNPPLMILFHCNGIENSLIDCSSSTIDTCSNTVATITCGGMVW